MIVELRGDGEFIEVWVDGARAPEREQIARPELVIRWHELPEYIVTVDDVTIEYGELTI